eukprot:TRINITY_DN10137_c0_g1_i2.p1 TRINITY_DN10137_c0_g1~~TRINITY_DN10137_c0_g1_i2.p1  ORF type:complete len:405 (+),score=81.79 TRINITY_DN10137_c0_g1_i2:73-1287(+)
MAHESALGYFSTWVGWAANYLFAGSSSCDDSSSPVRKKVRWQFSIKRDLTEWRNMDSDMRDKLEDFYGEYQKSQLLPTAPVITSHGCEYEIDFSTMTQINTRTKNKRAIRREMVIDEDALQTWALSLADKESIVRGLCSSWYYSLTGSMWAEVDKRLQECLSQHNRSLRDATGLKQIAEIKCAEAVKIAADYEKEKDDAIRQAKLARNESNEAEKSRIEAEQEKTEAIRLATLSRNEATQAEKRAVLAEKSRDEAEKEKTEAIRLATLSRNEATQAEKRAVLAEKSRDEAEKEKTEAIRLAEKCQAEAEMRQKQSEEAKQEAEEKLKQAEIDRDQAQEVADAKVSDQILIMKKVIADHEAYSKKMKQEMESMLLRHSEGAAWNPLNWFSQSPKASSAEIGRAHV